MTLEGATQSASFELEAMVPEPQVYPMLEATTQYLSPTFELEVVGPEPQVYPMLEATTQYLSATFELRLVGKEGQPQPVFELVEQIQDLWHSGLVARRGVEEPLLRTKQKLAQGLVWYWWSQQR
jgi:hypothetical protein